MRTTRKVMSVEIRSRSEWAASAKRPRLPDNRPTRSLRAAKLPLATIEAVVTACLELVPESFPTSLFESHGRRIPSSGFEFVAEHGQRNRSSGVQELQEFRSNRRLRTDGQPSRILDRMKVDESPSRDREAGRPHSATPELLQLLQLLTSEVLFLTGICKSFIDRSVKYGCNFLSSKRIQAGAKKIP